MIISKDKQTVLFFFCVFFFVMGNTALENGFKSGENWEVHMATAAEKKAFEKQYHPTVATSVSPDLLGATFALVKAQLNQAIRPETATVPGQSAPHPEYQYLVAFSANRIRR